MEKQDTNYPSRYAINEQVMFMGSLVKVIGIKFTESKVLYDLDLGPEYLPLKEVDSNLVSDIE
jgi:hypothetical protein